MLTYILSRTVSKLLQIIDQLCTFDRGGVPLFNTLVLGEPLNLGPQHLASTFKKLGPYVMQNAFQFLEPFSRGSRVWRTDRRTSDRRTSDGQTDKTAVGNSAV